jgi:hypothetical protein
MNDHNQTDLSTSILRQANCKRKYLNIALAGKK